MWVVPVTLGAVTGCVMHSIMDGLLVALPITALWALVSLKKNYRDRKITYDDNGFNIEENGAIEAIPWSSVTNVVEHDFATRVDSWRFPSHVMHTYLYALTYNDQTGQSSTLLSVTGDFYTLARNKLHDLQHPELQPSNDNHLIIGKQSLPNHEPEK